MSVRHRFTEEGLRSNGFTHTGLAYGLIPVYIANLTQEAPTLVTRNWIPEFALDLAEMIYPLAQVMFPDDDPRRYIIPLTRIEEIKYERNQRT